MRLGGKTGLLTGRKLFMASFMAAVLTLLTGCVDDISIGLGGGFGGSSATGPGAPGQPIFSTDAPDIPRPAVSPSQMFVPTTGEEQFEQGGATIDTSNTSDGYVMVRYTGTASRVVVQVIAGELTYNFNLDIDGNWEVFPLAAGNGRYIVNVLENVEGQMFAMVSSIEIDVQLSHHTRPFLFPNQYVHFTPQSQAVALSASLSEGATSDIEVVARIYNFIVNNIEYDYDFALAVLSGEITSYVPDVDVTLDTMMGICFDYAALMAAMLRAQHIPTRMEIGYVSGGIYHAWVTVYTHETGWIHVAEFSPGSWTLMDPTFTAGALHVGADLSAFIGDATGYITMFIY